MSKLRLVTGGCGLSGRREGERPDHLRDCGKQYVAGTGGGVMYVIALPDYYLMLKQDAP